MDMLQVNALVKYSCFPVMQVALSPSGVSLTHIYTWTKFLTTENLSLLLPGSLEALHGSGVRM